MTPILPTLSNEQLIQAITDAREVVESMQLVAIYSIAAFEVVLKRKIDDAYAQLTLENALLIQSIGERIDP